jgi:hypothetical protein
LPDIQNRTFLEMEQAGEDSEEWQRIAEEPFLGIELFWARDERLQPCQDSRELVLHSCCRPWAFQRDEVAEGLFHLFFR